MRPILLALFALLLLCGCDTRSKLYAPEGEPGSLSDATFATPKTVAHDVLAKLKPNDFCVYVGGEIGWSCTNDTWDAEGRHVLADDDTYLAAPKFKMAEPAATANSPGDPTGDD